jgi:hypothetical protein
MRSAPSAQDAARVGATADPSTAPLVAGSRPGRGRRQHLRRPGVAGRCGPAAGPGDRGDPPAAGRGAVRPGTTARARDQGATARQGRPPADVGGAPARSRHALGDAHRPLVWRRDCSGGGRDRHRHLVSPRRPDRRATLGAAPRSVRPVRAASPLSTDPTVPPAQIAAWFVARWPLEVTFQEVRAHLGVETQRQWSDLAILRTTPALLGLFSLVALFAQARLDGQPLPVRQAAWYAKSAPTFSDTLAFIRQQFWPVTVFSTSPTSDDVIKIPRALFDRLTDTLAFAA